MDIIRTELTEEEWKQIEKFSYQIDLSDMMMILRYGVSVQRKAASFADEMLKRLSLQKENRGTDTLKRLSAFAARLQKEQSTQSGNPEKEEKLQEIISDYEKMIIQLEHLCAELQTVERELMKEQLLLEKMYRKMTRCCKEIFMYVESGNRCLQRANAGTDNYKKLKERLLNLETSAAVCMQNIAQIEVFKERNKKTSEDIRMAIMQTIPLCRVQISGTLKKLTRK